MPQKSSAFLSVTLTHTGNLWRNEGLVGEGTGGKSMAVKLIDKIGADDPLSIGKTAALTGSDFSSFSPIYRPAQKPQNAPELSNLF